MVTTLRRGGIRGPNVSVSGVRPPPDGSPTSALRATVSKPGPLAPRPPDYSGPRFSLIRLLAALVSTFHFRFSSIWAR